MEEINKYIFSSQQFETKRSFTRNNFAGKVTLNDADLGRSD